MSELPSGLNLFRVISICAPVDEISRSVHSNGVLIPSNRIFAGVLAGLRFAHRLFRVSRSPSASWAADLRVAAAKRFWNDIGNPLCLRNSDAAGLFDMRKKK